MRAEQILFIIIISLLLGCGSNTMPKKTNTFDPTIAPISKGSWYKPDQNSSWQWQLQGDINTSYAVDLYDIDLFDSNKTPQQRQKSHLLL